MGSQSSGVDVVTTEIIRNGLIAATDEMARTLVRTAFNPLLYEVQDFSVCIVSADARLWAETSGITIFSRALPDVVKGGLRKYGVGGIAEGDVLIANDPYETGSHISDTSVYMPVFHDGELIAFAASTAHWADIGGKNPGGWCPDSTDVYQEGICFTHQKLVAAGEPNDALWDLIAHNVRVPVTVKGDLEAQIAACLQGAERVKAVCGKYGSAAVNAAMDRVIAETAKVMAGKIAEIPDGDYGASLHLDADGVDPEGEFNIAVQVRIAGNKIRFSFDGSSPAAKGPINLPEIGAVGAVFTVLKGLILPHDPTNEGHFQDLEVDLPPGLLVSPQRPSPTDSFGYVLNSLIELMLRALSEALPERCPAGGLQMFGVGFNRINPRDGKPFIYLEPLGGGNGGQPAGDGPTMTIIGGGDVPNVPVEVMENRFPLQTTCLELFPEVAGAGMFRGGFGIRKDYRILESGIFLSFSTENTEDVLCRGMKGGNSGLPSAVVIAPGTDSEAVFNECVSYYGPLPEDEIVSLRSGGGGGWGDPRGRDPERVLGDVRNGFIGAEEARTHYGVTVIEDQDGWRVDEKQTNILRSES